MHVRVRGLGWRHPGRRAWALRGVDLEVAAGERVLLLGPSGAGKSTLLAALAGLLDPETGDLEGEVLLDGVPAVSARSRAGLLRQDPQTQLVMTRAGDDVAFGLENRGTPADRIWPRVHETLALVGWRYAPDRSTAALSGGEAQRLALAGVLAPAPGLLLLDEPTADLDPDGADLLRAALRDGLDATGSTCVVVEHRVGPTLPLVSRVVVLEPGGGVVADGDPAQVLAARGEELAAAGVWVPGREPRPSRRAVRAPGEVLLTTSAVDSDRFSPGARRVAADLAVRAGEATAVLGPNGSGKSTLALVLGGLEPPDAGEVRATDALAAAARAGRGDRARPLHAWPARTLARAVGNVLQAPEDTFLARTVAEELALGPRRQGRGQQETGEVVDRLLASLRLTSLARAHPFSLSGGEARRLSVAAALVSAPPVLVLDEPTSGQDSVTWAELVGLLADLRDAGRAVVAVTHDLPLVEALADRVLRTGEDDPPGGGAPPGAPDAQSEPGRPGSP